LFFPPRNAFTSRRGLAAADAVEVIEEFAEHAEVIAPRRRCRIARKTPCNESIARLQMSDQNAKTLRATSPLPRRAAAISHRENRT
jgi:hypothetical protein